MGIRLSESGLDEPLWRMSEMSERVAGEFAWVELGDRRLNARVASVAAQLSRSPAVAFPKVLTEAELSAYYRLVNHESVSFERLLEAHVEASKRRAEVLPRVIVAHDTSDFRFSDEVAREGLGRMDNGGQGFYGHASVAFDEERRIVGTLAFEPWIRAPKDPDAIKRTQKERYESTNNESLRWMRAVHRTEKELAGTGAALVHVMDREADDYDILCELRSHSYQFVIRASTDRLLSPRHGGVKLKEFARSLDVRIERSAQLAHRKKKRRPKERTKFPPRKLRDAHLSFSVGRVALRRPDIASKDLPAELELSLVHVWELHPPEDGEPIEWFLLTDQPVGTEEQILRIVDDYRTRWGIEEFFKVLKTGCSIEKRQHESAHAMLNTLAIALALAWALMTLRHAARDARTQNLPATEVLNPRQLEILRIRSRGTLPANPTVEQTVLALARFFGGHLRGNGPPGWQVLGRAYESLLLVEFGWWLATKAGAGV